MIRTILCVLFVILYLILSLPIMLVLVLVRQFRPEAAELAMLRVVQAAFRGVYLIAGAKLTVIGKERIPKEEAVLYVGNHQSIFDIVVTYAQVPDRTGFISKDSVKKVPVLNLNMVFLNCLFLKRDDIRQGLETIKKAIELVKNGVQCVCEGANMPTSIDATKYLQANGVLFAPGKASNAGGVATSGLEMSQNSERLSWTFDQVDSKLKSIMIGIYKNCESAAEEYGLKGNYVAGANIAGFTKVVDAMLAHGAC